MLFCSIHAAQPTPRHLRSVCTEVALVVSDLLRYEDQKPERALRCLDWIVPTLRVGTQRLTLCVNGDAERPGRHSYAERGNDQTLLLLPGGRRSPACPTICCAAVVKPNSSAVSGRPHSQVLLPLRVRSSGCNPETSHDKACGQTQRCTRPDETRSALFIPDCEQSHPPPIDNPQSASLGCRSCADLNSYLRGA